MFFDSLRRVFSPSHRGPAIIFCEAHNDDATPRVILELLSKLHELGLRYDLFLDEYSEEARRLFYNQYEIESLRKSCSSRFRRDPVMDATLKNISLYAEMEQRGMQVESMDLGLKPNGTETYAKSFADTFL